MVQNDHEVQCLFVFEPQCQASGCLVFLLPLLVLAKRREEDDRDEEYTAAQLYSNLYHWIILPCT